MHFPPNPSLPSERGRGLRTGVACSPLEVLVIYTSIVSFEVKR